jgi:hypothetical protein
MSACDHSSPNDLKRDAAPRLIALGDGHERDFASGVFDWAPHQRNNQRHSERNCDDRESQQIEHGQLPRLASKLRHPMDDCARPGISTPVTAVTGAGFFCRPRAAVRTSNEASDGSVPMSDSQPISGLTHMPPPAVRPGPGGTPLRSCRSGRRPCPR